MVGVFFVIQNWGLFADHNFVWPVLQSQTLFHRASSGVPFRKKVNFIWWFKNNFISLSYKIKDYEYPKSTRV